ncbi:hypothetical protein QE449_001637 [Rhodococcus sp. SORGH_AS303]|nr:hypothetical protein [Rhodococcus sp. SORGH_AS_0303]
MVQCRSSPSRTNTSCDFSTTSAYTSPAGPPPGPTSPCAARRMRIPLPTPAGTFTASSRRARTRPSPPHLRQGSGIVSPAPRQVGHGRAVMTCPRNDRWTDCTSPAPLHVSQRTGVESPLVPEPVHTSHSTAVSTAMCLVTPVAHSSSVSVVRSSESEPGWTRPRGPRVPPPLPPKNASNTSPSPPPKPAPPKPPAPPPPPLSSGSPPRSTMRRFSGSDSTSYAELMSLKRAWADSSGLTSGWNSRASLRYARLISWSDALLSTPRVP